MGTRLTALSNFMLFQRALTRRNDELSKASEQLSTQKQINRPSDNPEAAKTVLSFKQALERMDQYKNNLTFGDQFLKQTEAALNSTKDILVRAKELAIQGKNGTQNVDSRKAIAAEVQQLQKQLLVTANSEINGEYIFAGYRSNTVPFALDAAQPNADPVVTYSGDTNVRSIQISESSNLEIQSRGDQVFRGDGTASTVDLFQTLADLEVALRAGNVDDSNASSVGAQIDKLTTGFNQVVNEITSIGANQNRIETTRNFLDAQNETLKSFVSSLEDADLSQAAFEYQRTNVALEATINVSGNILKLPSLMDFIK
jgi:flagellar hook-associated protein 3 FlgL